jgi:hypothetical protein
MMEISVRLEGFDEALKLFDPSAVRKAAASTLNKSAAQGKTEASRAIREVYNISAARLNQYLRISVKAREGALSAIISGRGRGLPLYEFGAKQEGVRVKVAGAGKHAEKYITLKGKRTRGGAVSVLVKKTAGRKPVLTDPKAFIQRMPSGHIGVIRREGPERYPVRELYGPGAAVMFANPDVMDRVIKRINEKFSDIFLHDLEYYQKQVR